MLIHKKSLMVRTLRAAFCGAILTFSSSMAQTANTVLQQTGVDAGLCLVVGNLGTPLLADLTNSGKMLVSALVKDDKTVSEYRDFVGSKGLRGFVSIERPFSLSPLPFGGNVVNLLVADLDDLGASAPNEAEVMRVLAPFGAAYVKMSGTWKTLKKGMPENMDDWTHRYHRQDGNPISNDRAVRSPSDRIRFHTGLRYGMDLKSSFVMSEGYYFQELEISNNGKISTYLSCRNALNGIPIWRIEGLSGGVGKNRPNPIIGDGLVFTMLKKDTPIQAYDLKTGALVREFPGAGTFKDSDITTREGTYAHAIYFRKTLFVPNVKNLTALDVSNGAVKWQYAAKDNWVIFPVADTVNNKIFVAEGPRNQESGRWDGADITAVVCLNAIDGKVLWRCDSFVGKGGGTQPNPNLTQLIYSDGNVYMFSAIGIIAKNGDPYFGKIRASDGAYLWGSHYQLQPTRYKRSYGDRKYVDGKASSYWGTDILSEVIGGERGNIAQVGMIRKGIPYATEAGGFVPLDPETGKPLPRQESTLGNKCERAVATQDYFITAAVSMTSWEDRKWSQSFITRSACSGAGTPAYGGLYFGSGWCTCHNNLRGLVCLTSSTNEALRAPVPDGERTRTSPLATLSTVSPQKYDKSNLIVNEWDENFYMWNQTETPKVSVVGLTVSAKMHEGLVLASDGGGVKWAFQAGGRISRAPIVYNNRLYFGSHDGWVYCLNPANGALQWQFLAAPVEEKIVAFGQLESRWPVHGVGEADGMITCAAGRHSEADGGIWVWALDPVTGKATSKVRFYSPAYVPGDSKTNQSRGLISMNMVGKTVTMDKFNRDSFRNDHGRTNPVSDGGSYTVDFNSWNGLVINPKNMGTVGLINPKGSFMGNALPDNAPGRVKIVSSSKGLAIITEGTYESKPYQIRLTDGQGRIAWETSSKGSQIFSDKSMKSTGRLMAIVTIEGRVVGTRSVMF